MNFGTERMQAHRKGFVLLLGNEIDFGVEQLANEGTSFIEAVHFLPSQLGQGCFSPISNCAHKEAPVRGCNDKPASITVTGAINRSPQTPRNLPLSLMNALAIPQQ